jgi:hypothetical protein
MATAKKTDVSSCLMCLESPAVMTVGTCQHSYCRPCFDKHKEAQQQDGETPCPACQTQRPRKEPEETSGAVVDDAGPGPSEPERTGLATSIHGSNIKIARYVPLKTSKFGQ